LEFSVPRTFCGGYTPRTFNDPFVNGTDRVQWAWSRSNKLDSANWNSVLSSTLLNEFTFAFNSDGTGCTC